MAKKPAGGIVKWDAELAKEAEVAAQMEANTGGGKFLSVKGGVLTWNDAPVPGNEMPIVILDHIFENVMYEGDYDADNPTSPTCFAFGRDEKTMEPHQVPKDAGTAQEGPCVSCPMNVFGSADKGKGKACKNTRRLGLISAGSFAAGGKFKMITDPEYYEKEGEVGFFKIPVTSIKMFGGFVKQVASALKRPPHGIITRVKVVPDPKSQFKVVFEPMQNLPDSLMTAIMKRRDEVKGVIDFPYQAASEEEAPAKTPKKGGKKGRY